MHVQSRLDGGIRGTARQMEEAFGAIFSSAVRQCFAACLHPKVSKKNEIA